MPLTDQEKIKAYEEAIKTFKNLILKAPYIYAHEADIILTRLDNELKGVKKVRFQHDSTYS